VAVFSELGRSTTADLFFPSVERDTRMHDATRTDAPGDLPVTYPHAALPRELSRWGVSRSAVLS
jgi:hypothetical protein